MSVVTRQEFADLCKTTVAVVNVNISRKKISTLVGNKKMIDTDNPLNKIFKKNQLQLAKEKVANERAEKKKDVYEKASHRSNVKAAIEELGFDEEVESEIFPDAEEETPQQKRRRIQQNEEDKDTSDWDLRKKKADAMKAEESAKLEALKVEKMMGNLMPVDLVTTILSVNIHHIHKNYENDIINIASIFCDKMAGGDRTKLAEIISDVRFKLEETIKRTEKTAAIEIDNVIDSYAEARSRGERK